MAEVLCKVHSGRIRFSAFEPLLSVTGRGWVSCTGTWEMSFGRVGHFFLSLLGVQRGCAWSILARRDYRLRVLELFFKWNWKDWALLVWWQSEYRYLFFCHGFTGSHGKFKTTYGEMMERHAIARVQEFREVTEKYVNMFGYEVLINWHACEQFKGNSESLENRVGLSSVTAPAAWRVRLLEEGEAKSGCLIKVE